MHILAQTPIVDWIDPSFGVPLTVIVWIVLFIVILVGLRKAKIKRDKIRRARIRAARRETYIQIAQEKEEAYIESLNKYTPKDTQ